MFLYGLVVFWWIAWSVCKVVYMLVCAGRSESLCCAVPIGVGLVEASLGLTRLLLGGARETESIIFVGSAGAYSKEILIGDMFFSVEATQIESSFLSGGSYTPIDNVVKMESMDLNGSFARFFMGDEDFSNRKSWQKNVSYETSGQTPKSIQNQKIENQDGQKSIQNGIVAKQLKQAIVNSSNYITTDEDSANQMARAGIALENMEFYAVMKVAQNFGVSAMGVFCITNYCDKNAHNDFLANHSEAKRRLEHFIMQNQRAMI